MLGTVVAYVTHTKHKVPPPISPSDSSVTPTHLLKMSHILKCLIGLGPRFFFSKIAL